MASTAVCLFVYVCVCLYVGLFVCLSVCAGIDHLLAQHIAHLFIRDPVSVFHEKVDLDDTVDTDHFEVCYYYWLLFDAFIHMELRMICELVLVIASMPSCPF